MAERDDCCGVDDELIQSPGYRRALWIVIVLNVGYGVIELIGGFFANSQALKADALDFLGDGSITFLGLLAIGWSAIWRARSALLQGLFLGVLGAWVLVSTILKTLSNTPVDAGLMGLFAFIALLVNLIAVIPLLPYRNGDASMRAVWLFFAQRRHRQSGCCRCGGTCRPSVQPLARPDRRNYYCVNLYPFGLDDYPGRAPGDSLWRPNRTGCA